MLKCISICAVLLVVGNCEVKAQQQEATLQKVELPGTGFDIVFAMAKPGGAIADLRGMPDPLVVYSGEGKLAFAMDDKVLEILRDVDVLNAPPCTFQMISNEGNSPVTLYVVPKYERTAAIQVASQPVPFMRKVEVPGAALDIVYATIKMPVIVKPNEAADTLAVYSVGSELMMAADGDVEKMFKDVGYSELPACAFEVEHKGSNLQQATSVYVFLKRTFAGIPKKGAGESTN